MGLCKEIAKSKAESDNNKNSNRVTDTPSLSSSLPPSLLPPLVSQELPLVYVGGKLIGGAEKVNAQVADGSLKKTVAALRQVGREGRRKGGREGWGQRSKGWSKVGGI